MKTYRGSRERGKVWIESAEYEGGWRDLPLRLDVFNRSPSGFEWGYLGSGPAQLALAILCDYLGEPQLAVRFYLEFKADIVARWKDDEWALTEQELAEWFDKDTRRPLSLVSLSKSALQPTPPSGDAPSPRTPWGCSSYLVVTPLYAATGLLRA